MKKSAFILAAISLAATCYAGSEAPVRSTNVHTQVIYTNTTWRQWVGSVFETFVDSATNNIATVSVIDQDGYEHVVASASNSAMKTFLYVSERGPVVLNKGDKLKLFNSDNGTAVAVFNMLTGE